MKYVAALLLAQLGGKKEPNKKDVEKILSSVGVDADDKKLVDILEKVKGKGLDEALNEGLEKISSITAAAAAAAPVAVAAPVADAKKDEKKVEEKKEEKKVEEEEEDAYEV